MGEFAEQEIILPSGPYAGEHFRMSRQPFTRLWFQEVDKALLTGCWRRFVATGPTQSGKTLCCSVIPCLYFLFEMGETVIYGIPTNDMAADKWREDFLPVIQATRYRDFLPEAGTGSRGGLIRNAVRFKNGTTLRFMSGAGGDKARAGFTSRVLAVTEVDGMDVSTSTSPEADKITQLEGRTRAFHNAVTFLECTVTTEKGRTWREYTAGTNSRIAQRCPHCERFVTLTREDLRGWQAAGTKVEAAARAHYVCPQCEHAWTEDDRFRAAHDSILVHEGQEPGTDGTTIGEIKPTDTLGFRWSAPDNLLLTAGHIGADEWTGKRDPDESNAERKLCQFVWALPYDDDVLDLSMLDPEGICSRTVSETRGVLPGDTEYLSIGCDLGIHLCHYIVLAWRAIGAPHIVDYARIETPSAEFGWERGIKLALEELHSRVQAGWSLGGGHRAVDAVWVDSGGQWTDVVYKFCSNVGKPFLPSKGFGQSQEMARVYTPPKQKSNIIRQIGPGYHLVRLRDAHVTLAECNADHWKTFAHDRLMTPLGKPGAMTLFHVAQPLEHLALAKHLTAEKQTEEYEPGKGTFVRWEHISRNNHWFDGLWLACAAAHYAGARLPENAITSHKSTRRGWYGASREVKNASPSH